MIRNLNKLAREIVENNQYMTLGSSDKDGNTWVSPIVYSYDTDFNFYFVSIPNSRHGENIKENSNVTFAIFDSHQLIGEGVGLQIEGKVKELGIKEIPLTAPIYFKRNYPYGKIKNAFNAALKRFLEKKLYHFYKITPTKTWMNNPNSEIDERVEIDLSGD